MSKHVELDELDHRILDLLHDDGRIPFTSIAKELNVAEATVRKRVSRLLDEGIVNVIGIVNPKHVGLPVAAMVGVKTAGQNVENIVEELKEWEEVRYASVCTGTYDLMLEVVVPSNEALFHFLTKKLRAVPGVVGSDTSMVMKVVKDRYEWRGGDARRIPDPQTQTE